MNNPSPLALRAAQVFEAKSTEIYLTSATKEECLNKIALLFDEVTMLPELIRLVNNMACDFVTSNSVYGERLADIFKKLQIIQMASEMQQSADKTVPPEKPMTLTEFHEMAVILKSLKKTYNIHAAQDE